MNVVQPIVWQIIAENGVATSSDIAGAVNLAVNLFMKLTEDYETH
jgi:hypothetical protein